LGKAETFTVGETSFPNPKPRGALLIAYKAFADLAGKGSLFVITVVAARRLSPESFGVFSLGSTLGWMLAVVSDFGIQLHLARAVARRPAEAPRLLHEWLRVRLWTAAGATALVALGVAAAWSASSATPIAILAVVYACTGLIELLHYFYRGLSRSDVESALTLWQRGGTLAFGLLALAWKPDVTILALAMLIPVAVTLAVSVRIATRLARRPEGAKDGGQLRPQIDADPDAAVCSWPVFRRDVWPIGAGIVLSALYFRIDVFLVQLWSGTEAVALYNAVFRLVEALRLFPAAVLAVVLPSLVRAGDLRPLTRVAVPVTGFAVAVTAVLWVSARWLIPFLYGAPYAAAVPAFRVLALSFPLLSLNYALTHQLVGWDGQRAYLWLCALALVVNVAVNARLIPLWSIEGAAWATLATEIVITAGCCIALWSTRAAPHVGPLVSEA
jgi:O-antigen/teichoic acid export membrane protein